MSNEPTEPLDLSKLNDEQRRAVVHTGGPLAVLAGPGTGKTLVIVSRIAKLVQDGVDPSSILGLTFGVKAAHEMQHRLVKMLGARKGSNVTLSTFHGWGRRFLTRYGDIIGHRASPSIMDSATESRLIADLITSNGLFRDTRAMGVERGVEIGREFIEKSRNAGREASEGVEFARTLADRDTSELDENDRVAFEVEAARFRDAAELYRLYEAACADRGMVSMGEYIIAPVRIMRRNETVRRITRSEIKHVVVDEYQDVNLCQIELLRLLCPPEAKPDLCVVGDDDQAIYAFRGSDERAFARFTGIWPDHTTQPLVTNYRSTKTIVDLATAFIAKSESRFDPDKTLRANTDEPGDPVSCITCTHPSEYGVVIASLIRSAIAHDPTLKLGQIAVIGPTHNVLETVQAELNIAEIPTVRGRESSATDDDAVQDLFAWMRLVTDGSGSADTMRLLRRPLFGVTIEEVTEWSKAWRRATSAARRAGNETPALLEWLAADKGDDERVERFVSTTRSLRERAIERGAGAMAIEIVRACHLVESTALSRRERAQRVRTVARVLRFIGACEPAIVTDGGTLDAFLDHYSRLSPREQAITDTGEDRVDGSGESDDSGSADAVHLLTAHASKGLEFHHVYCVGVSPGGFPKRNVKDERPIDLPAEYLNAEVPDDAHEQRRLFYVAMTRAERRLTLLAKRKKKRGTTIDYFYEITEDLNAANLLPQEGEEILDRDDEAQTGDAVDLYLAREGALTPEQARVLRRVRSLREELLRLSYVVEHAPSDAERDEIAEKSARIVLDLATASREPAPAEPDCPVFPGLTGPLELSYTKIEDYNRCPRCFYAKHILGIPDEQTSRVRTGTIAHDTLERFFTEVRDYDTGEIEREPDEARLLEIARAQYDASVRAQSGGGLSGAGVPDESQWETLASQLRTALNTLHDRGSNIVELERKIEPIPLPIDGVEHTLTAKIDRIDFVETTSGKQGYRIIDYKTGKPVKAIRTPAADDLQLGIYCKAIMWYFDLDESPAGDAEYWVLQTGERGVLPFASLNMDKIDKAIKKAVDGMLAGEWTPRSGHNCGAMAELLPI